MLDVVGAPAKDWADAAECAGSPPTAFYPTTLQETKDRDWEQFCDICPVRVDCLAHAFHARESHGIWGGSDELDRERILRRLRRETLTWATVATGALWPHWKVSEATTAIMA